MNELCEPSTIIDSADDRVIQSFERSFGVKLDDDYKASLPHIHGGIPHRQYFQTETGRSLRLGRFLYFVDSSSTLTAPMRPFRNDARIADERVFDLGVPYICGQILGSDAHPDVEDNEFDFFFGAKRMIPFGALFTRTNRGKLIDPNGHGSSLHNNDLAILDTICFDRLTSPHKIVYYKTSIAAPMSYESAWDDQYVANYDKFVEPVADSFREFIALLRAK